MTHEKLTENAIKYSALNYNASTKFHFLFSFFIFSFFFLIHLQNELKFPFFAITIHSTLISKLECTQIPSKTLCYYTSLELVWSSKGWHEHG